MNYLLSAVYWPLMNYLLSAVDWLLMNYLLSAVDRPLMNCLLAVCCRLTIDELPAICSSLNIDELPVIGSRFIIDELPAICCRLNIDELSAADWSLMNYLLSVEDIWTTLYRPLTSVDLTIDDWSIYSRLNIDEIPAIRTTHDTQLFTTDSQTINARAGFMRKIKTFNRQHAKKTVHA